MSQTLPRILITGGTGFIGAHIVHQALEAGYPVRITARPAKVESMQKKYGGKVEVTPVADIGTDDLTEAFQDIGAIIHTAAGIPAKQDPDAMYNSAINGALNVLKHALAAHIHRVVITSSFVTAESFTDNSVFLTDRLYTDKDWNNATEEQIHDGTHDNLWIYTAIKTLAEKEIWKFAEKHPEIDITTINPPIIYGPLAPGVEVAKGDFGGLSTDGILLRDLLSNGKLPAKQLEIPPQQTDVRDVAKAHILALNSPLSSSSPSVGRKRILLGGPGFLFKDAVELLYEKRPELREKLSDASEAERTPIARVDNSRAKDVLGMPEFINWEDTVLDTVDSLTAVLSSWA